ncbi:MAG: hypothetical protein M0T79_15450 [Actinomycetota bacterium]|nr:hypothetical protein [Actinomycetota bacterium]
MARQSNEIPDVRRAGAILDEHQFVSQRGTDMSFEFDDDAIRNLANRAVTMRAQEMQALLDEVRSTEQDVEAARANLAFHWRATFDRDLTDPHLSAWAEHSAKGGTVIVEPELKSM